MLKKLAGKKRLATCLIPLLLSACAVTSTVVSSIGARSVNGKAPLPAEATEVEIPVTDSSCSLQGMAVAHFAAIPYSSLSPAPDGEAAGRIALKLSDIRWSSETRGEVTLLHAGRPTNFDVIRSTHEGQGFVALESRYRRWYGYPAQGLLLASVPLDVAIDVVVLGGVVVSMPFVYGVRALQGDKADDGAGKRPAPP